MARFKVRVRVSVIGLGLAALRPRKNIRPIDDAELFGLILIQLCSVKCTFRVRII
jgi:hypothetical protein